MVDVGQEWPTYSKTDKPVSEGPHRSSPPYAFGRHVLPIAFVGILACEALS
ncbi:hypothetical protein RBWH47_03340 [Rhodopirellula baltica WH47]|uniref:Uncharacterized protein n=1 Tax=Rhodopirellula baltica WH47 TaxID=991778 RepID=F2B222_RHOBT|nr:hypothetical protein RBWH47_03340 [Rhodopirellula baltica WH47]